MKALVIPLRVTILINAALLLGCDSSDPEEATQKKPRPVQVQVLQVTPPPVGSLVSASVASWKTEEIGMEVGGRIEWVVEPNVDIEGRVVGKDGTVLVEGSPIARIDDERYRLQVENAKAQVERARQTIKAAEIEIQKSIPAQVRAAEADKKLALTELDRSRRLARRNAGAQSDVDRDEATYESAIASIEQLQSTLSAKESDLQSLNLQLLQNQKSLRDAEADLEDCTLFSSFRGQISDVNVVPGSVITAGQEIATIQMMDPIKVELEVSSEDSRRLRNRQQLPVLFTSSDGSTVHRDGYLYLVDPVADPQTRTFTLTLLVMNERLDQPQLADNVATTDQIWRMDFQFLPGAKEGKTYLSEDAILKDASGHFVWRVDNVTIGQQMPKDRLLKVRKVPVILGQSRLPFLGNWIFQEVEIQDDTFDPKRNVVAGKLAFDEGDPNEWNGDTIMIQDSGQWMLRPGDLVKVDLSENEANPGIFVPMDAISHQAGRTYLFLVDESATPSVVQKVEVTIEDGTAQSTASSMLRIGATDSDVAIEGKPYVTRGTHYLRDQEAVRVVKGEGIQ